MTRLNARLLALPLAALAIAAVPAQTPAPSPHGRTYLAALREKGLSREPGR